MKKTIRKFLSLRIGSLQRKKLLANGKRIYVKGFTLIELLVAMFITSIIVSVMLTFLVGVLESDRKEQAKSEAQEEVQAALSYITDDIQEALYIYDATSLSAINSQLPHKQSDAPNDSSTEGCREDTKCTPILVFWKRYVYEPTTKLGTDYLGCLPYKSGTADYIACNTSASSASAAPFGGDNFTFSLVAYYLKSDVNNNSSTWSNTSRILRWELKDGYRWYCADNSVGCPDDKKLNGGPSYRDSNGNPAISPVITDKNPYFILPDKGFNRPDFVSAGTLSQNASKWKKFDDFDFGTNKFTTLVDFIDDTKYDDTQIKIDVGANSTTAPFNNPDCQDPVKGVGVTDPVNMIAQRVPADFSNGIANPSELTSFYACVAPEQVTARVYLRGNALSRIQFNRTLRKPTDNNSTFFPSLNARIFGRSSLGLNKK